jgi:pSer/pThr/pTyr-binding forkhead associated (FHA) protein
VEPLVLHLPDGRVVEARPQLVIGRDPRCGCPLDDGAVSTLHARLGHDASGWFVEDLQSRNGTWVSDDRVAPRAPIRPGDVLRVGSTRIRVGRSEAPAASGAVAAASPPPAAVAGAVTDTLLAPDHPEALLRAGRKGSTDDILARFEKLAGELQQKIQHAPTPALRRMYQRQLNDLVKAKDALLRG